MTRPVNSLLLALRVARRDLRGALGSFWILVAGIAIGVAAIAAIGSVAGAVLDGVRAGAQATVGGDVSLRLFHRPADPEQRAFLSSKGVLSETAELRPLARRMDGSAPTLVELKGVDATYPLYGAVTLGGKADLSAALAERDGRWGAAVDPDLLTTMGLGLGDRLVLGEIEVEIRAPIVAEPDRALRAFSLGPRVMIARAALELSNLAPPGAQVYWYNRLRLAPKTDAAALIAEAERRFPDAGWRIVNAADGVPGVERTVRIGQILLVLAGLGVLLIGGVGVASAVSAHLSRKTDTIAILKSLGAPSRLVFAAYLFQVLAAALPAIAFGVALGGLAPTALRPLAGEWLPLADGAAIQLPALATAAGFGLLTALLFSLWPLGQTDRLTPQQLLRGTIEPPRPRRPGAGVLAAMATCAALLATLLLAGSAMPAAALAFALAAAAAVLLFLGLGHGVMRLAARMRAGRWIGRRPVLRLAVANLHRPGAVTRPVVMALGLSLTLVVAIKVIEDNAVRHLGATLPETAPDLIFINVPPEDGALFQSLAAGLDHVRSVERAPFLHARLSHIDGVPVHALRIPGDLAWVVRGDRGLSWRDTPPEGSALVEGEWWPQHRDGQTVLASLDAKVARGLGIGVGGRITLNLSGRPIEATVANLRSVDWSGLGLDFPILLSRPDPLPDHSEVAAVWTDRDAPLDPIEAALLARFPQSPPIRVAPVLQSFAGVARALAGALAVISGVTAAAALVVLAGGIAAGYRRRVREMVLLKVVGARPRQLALASAVEFMLLGGVTALLAAALGTGAAYGVVSRLMPETWQLAALAPLATAAAAVAAMGLTGALVARRPLSLPPARLLRERYPAG